MLSKEALNGIKNSLFTIENGINSMRKLTVADLGNVEDEAENFTYAIYNMEGQCEKAIEWIEEIIRFQEEEANGTD